MFAKAGSRNAQPYDILKKMLVNYQFRPGAPLVIGTLADALRSSTTPVRESLIRLHSECHADISPGRGFCAKTLTVAEMTNVLRLGHLILVEAAATSLGPTPHDGLTSVAAALEARGREVERLITSSDTESSDAALVQTLEDISEDMTALTANRAMIRAIRNANERTHFVRAIGLRSPDRRNYLVGFIRELSTALTLGDRDMVLGLLHADLQAWAADMPDLVRDGIAQIYESNWSISLTTISPLTSLF